MTATLLLRLDGPLQSWGAASRYARRDTLDHPTKSGVVGLCAAALGRMRDASVADLAGLRFGVLVVDPGRLLQDYHTVSNVIRASAARRVDRAPAALVRTWTAGEIRREPKLPSVGDNAGRAKHTELTWRMYLADALFIAGLEGSHALLSRVREALSAPVFPLALGRASCLPNAPVALVERDDGGVVRAPLQEALSGMVPQGVRWLDERQPDGGERARRVAAMRMIVECDPQEATIRVQDQPTEFAFGARHFTTRYARTVVVHHA